MPLTLAERTCAGRRCSGPRRHRSTCGYPSIRAGTGRAAMGRARPRADRSEVETLLVEARLPSMLRNRFSWPIEWPLYPLGPEPGREQGTAVVGGSHLRPLREKGPTAARASRSTEHAKARAGASSHVQSRNPRSSGSRVKRTPCACSASANTWHTPAGGTQSGRSKSPHLEHLPPHLGTPTPAWDHQPGITCTCWCPST